ncbi:MAG: hypothetical protein MUF18_18375 [Fimbriiglobus sp.]|nr:hypothetical protein [Fimbriiglobus sp.]
MNPVALLAFTLAAGLTAFGLFTAALQLRGMATLRARTHVPSDELAYLRGRHRRRLVIGGLMGVLGGLLAGVYLSGLEPRIDALITRPDTVEAGEKRELAPDERQLVKVWAGYWTVVVAVVLVVLGLAFSDAWATRRYAMQQYKIIREEHEAKLRRDLAVHKAQHDARKNATRGGEPAE